MSRLVIQTVIPFWLIYKIIIEKGHHSSILIFRLKKNTIKRKRIKRLFFVHCSAQCDLTSSVIVSLSISIYVIDASFSPNRTLQKNKNFFLAVIPLLKVSIFVLKSTCRNSQARVFFFPFPSDQRLLLLPLLMSLWKH